MIDTKRSFNRGVLAVIGCLILDMSVGEFNLLSFLYPYFSAYFHHYNQNITPNSMGLLPCIWVSVQWASSLLSIKLYNQLGFRVTFFIFLCIFFVGQIAASFLTNFYWFAIIYAGFGGTAQGGLIILPLYCCWRYFPLKYKGVVSGTIMSAYALGPVGSSFIVIKLMNPDNLEPVLEGDTRYFPQEVYRNVPTFLRTFGLVCFVAGLIGIALIWEPFEEEDLDEYALELSDHMSQVMRFSRFDATPTKPIENPADEPETPLPQSNKIKKGEYEINPLTSRDMLSFIKSSDFRKLYFVVFIGMLYPNFILFNFKQIGLERLQSPDKYLNIVGSIGSIFNGVSRIAIALIYQKYGFKVAALILIFIQFTSALTFLPMANNKFSFAISLFYFFNCYGGQLGLYPLIMHSLYKGKGALSYSIVFSAFALSILLVTYLHGHLTQHAELNTIFFLLAILSLAPIYFVIQIDKRLEVSDALIIHSVD